MTDEFDLDRFIRAQEPVMTQVRQELAAGRKRSHWMWFVFPQLAGLGHSAMARRYAISSLAEAQAYLEHPPPRPTTGRTHGTGQSGERPIDPGDLRKPGRSEVPFVNDLVRLYAVRCVGFP
jgi:hypothetical protein